MSKVDRIVAYFREHPNASSGWASAALKIPVRDIDVVRQAVAKREHAR